MGMAQVGHAKIKEKWFVEFGMKKMKTQKVWFGVAGVLVLGASVAAFEWLGAKPDSMAAGKAPSQ